MNVFNNVCIYMRLSSDDGDKVESESISNQRKLLERYAEDIGVKIKKEYVDDGYSGTNFNRPKFKEMIQDITLNKIDTVIVKDLSRFARESIEASEYIEKFFPEHNVRFIAVLDNVDTYLDNLANMLVEFKLYNNQKFAKDTSEKMKKSKRANMEKGLYMGTYAPYGYKKDPDKKGHLLVDKETSKIVKKIFKMYLEGKSGLYIARHLTKSKIKTPSAYSNIIQYKKTNMYNAWKPAQILRILKNQVYIGSVVRNVENSISYRIRKKRRTKKEEWIVSENMHESIISKEDFNRVQELIKSKNCKAHKLKYNYLLRPYMHCGKCGRKVIFCTRHEGLVDIGCSKSKLGYCESFYYNYYKIEEKILNDIKEYYEKLVDIYKVENDIIIKKEKEESKVICEKINKLEYTYNRINDNIDALYMQKLDGLISKEAYLNSINELKQKREDINLKINDYKKINETLNSQNVLELKKFLEDNNENLKNNISRELLDKLIYKIDITRKEIVIHYKFKFF